MPTVPACHWSEVFPAATTQFDSWLHVDFRRTRSVQAALVRDGVHGLVRSARSARTIR